MLKFIFGRASSGKSTYIYNSIKENVNEHGNIILLVPEQYSFESEKAMLSLFGGGFSSHVEVLSFKRLVENAGRLYGGIAGKRINEAERYILMGKTIEKNAACLQVFKRFSSSGEFIKQIIKTVTELKMSGISADDIYNTSEKVDDNYLASKLREISVLYAAYDEQLKGTFIDPLDDLDRFCKKAKIHNFFSNKTIYIDAFKGFTGQQMKVLNLIVGQSKNIYISLCSNGKSTDETGVFSNVLMTAEKIKAFAIQNKLEIGEPILLDRNNYKSDDIRTLEAVLSGDIQEKHENKTENLVLAQLENPKDEIEYVFKKIHFLVRTERYMLKDFVIIARSIDKYAGYIDFFSRKYEMPCFFDRRVPLSVSPLIRFISFALKAAKNYNSAAILSMIKTGFIDISPELIGELEEYIYIWNINRSQWLNEWNMNPAGLEAGDKRGLNERSNQKLLRLNELRKKLISPLIYINKSFGKTALDISKCLFSMLEKLEINKEVKKQCGEFLKSGDTDTADFIMSSWDYLMQIFDSITVCLGNDEISADRYIDAFETGVNSMTVGMIPRTLDDISAGSADRIRPSRPKVVFAIGLNEQEFPKSADDGGILHKNDRIKMDAVRLELSDRFRRFTIDENFLAYTSLCCADEKVFACRHIIGFDGSECQPSAIIDKIISFFPNVLQENLDSFDYPETFDEAYRSYISKNFCDTSKLNAIGDILKNDDRYKTLTESCGSIENSETQRVDSKVISDIIGKKISLSPSKIERYNKCAFAYFCQHILNAKKPQKAELSANIRGTIVHYVLENVLRTLGKDIAKATDDEIKKLIVKYIDLYVSLIPGSETIDDKEFRYFKGEIVKTLNYVIIHISNEFKNSDFLPDKFELTIGDNAEVKPLEIKFGNDCTAVISGKIDRVDIMDKGENVKYIRIVDYKTGKKVFKLYDVFSGLNMQMLLYLYAAKMNYSNYKNSDVAGVLYMPSRNGVYKEWNPGDEKLCMCGLISDDREIRHSMDKSDSGDIIPPKTNAFCDYIPTEGFETVFRYIDRQVKKTAEKIAGGNFDILPLDGSDSDACKYCDYHSVCRRDMNKEVPKTSADKKIDVLSVMKEELENEI